MFFFNFCFRRARKQCKNYKKRSKSDKLLKANNWTIRASVNLRTRKRGITGEQRGDLNKPQRAAERKRIKALKCEFDFERFHGEEVDRKVNILSKGK